MSARAAGQTACGTTTPGWSTASLSSPRPTARFVQPRDQAVEVGHHPLQAGTNIWVTTTQMCAPGGSPTTGYEVASRG